MNGYKVEMALVSDLRPHTENDTYKTPLESNSDEYRLMAASIAVDGLRNPLLVQSGSNTIISGHTRWAIVRDLGWKEVPVRYLDVSDEQALDMLVQDNLERAGKERDLIKLARAVDRVYNRYHSDVGRTGAMTQVAQAFGVADRQIERMRSLLRLVKPLQDLVSSGKVGLKAGAALASGLDEEQQTRLWHQILQTSGHSDWRMTEEMARGYVASIKASHSNLSETVSTDISVTNVHGYGSGDEIDVTANQDQDIYSETESAVVSVHDTAMILAHSSAMGEIKKAMRMVEQIRTRTIPRVEPLSGRGDKDLKREFALLCKAVRDCAKVLSDITV